MKVYVTIYDHRHGNDVNVFASHELAEQSRQQVALEWWEEVFSNDEPIPDDPVQAADEYFEQAEDEFFDIIELEVQGFDTLEKGAEKAS